MSKIKIYMSKNAFTSTFALDIMKWNSKVSDKKHNRLKGVYYEKGY